LHLQPLDKFHLPIRSSSENETLGDRSLGEYFRKGISLKEKSYRDSLESERSPSDFSEHSPSVKAQDKFRKIVSRGCFYHQNSLANQIVSLDLF